MQLSNWTRTVGAKNVLLGSLAAASSVFGTVAASPLSDAIRALGEQAPLQRQVALKDLGITDPVVLAGNGSQDFYFPIPRGVALADRQVRLDARYLNLTALPGSASMVMSVQGVPVGGQKILDSEGSLQRSVAVSRVPNDAEFVRFGVNWKSKDALLRCEEDHTLANSLTISPETQLSYSIRPENMRTVEAVWSALPTSPVVLVAGADLDAASFDTAWRVVATLQRAGKRPRVVALPSVGQRFDASNLQVPAALARLPVFAGVQSNANSLEVRDEAQAAALTLLWLQQAGVDIAIADAALQQKLSAALSTLERQVESDGEALRALQQLGQQRWPLATQPLASKELRVLPLGRSPVLAVAADAGAKMAGLQENGMYRVAASPAVTVQQALPAQWQAPNGLSLARLGSSGDSFDVLARGFWNANYPLQALMVDGKVPSDLHLYVAAAPGASATRPVATVYWNGVLLAAKRLQAEGQPEHLYARIPSYALALNNTLSVQVQRQPYSSDCNEIPQAYPATVLPHMSYVQLGDLQAQSSFVGVLPLMNGETQLFVPEAYLKEAPVAIERVATLAAASGLSAALAQMQAVPAQQKVKPQKPFLSMNVALDGASSAVKVAEGGRLQVHGERAQWLDMQSLEQVSSAEVVRAGGQHGIWWNAIGAQPATSPAPFVLNRGNVAMLGHTGALAWFDNASPVGEHDQSQWRSWTWLLPVALVSLVLLMLLLALARRAKNKNASGHA